MTSVGGAIGSATAESISPEGGVVLANVDLAAAERTAEAIRSGDGRAAATDLDVSSEESWQATVEGAVSEFAGVRVLVNDAGLNSVDG